MNILELYSGIGGMHFALELSGVSGRVQCALDINQAANATYARNFPSARLQNGNVQGLSATWINELQADTILMSPPCQPFTRNGRQRGLQDGRTSSFVHVLKILPDLHIERILMENVKGFEESDMHALFMQTLAECGFHVKEFMLSPSDFNIPNSRTRYYCLARKSPFTKELSFEEHRNLPALKTFLGDLPAENTENFLVPMKDLLKRYKLLDIVHEESARSCCFTKSYGRYIEGTGSVFCPLDEQAIRKVCEQLNLLPDDEMGAKQTLLEQLQLRFFSPREISRLMCFPDRFSFPENLTTKHCYALLGNSLNCKIVAELIKLLE